MDLDEDDVIYNDNSDCTGINIIENGGLRVYISSTEGREVTLFRLGDENKCIGCGLCTTKCEFDAIHLFRENPDCSNMRKSEDKLKYILPYAAKQAIKIKFARKQD